MPLPLTDAEGTKPLTFKTEVLNLGELTYQQPRTVVFDFTNNGSETVQITSVKPSCGCTSVEWPQSLVTPGQGGKITATYDARMLGYFQKEIEVRVGAGEPIYLTMQGRVVAQATDVESDFPIDMGSMRLSTNKIAFDNVNQGDRPEANIYVLNNTRTVLKPELMHLPTYLTASYHPETLAGGRVGRINLKLHSDRLKGYGLHETSIYLSRSLGDKVNSENEIKISAVLLPNFSQVTEADLKTAPLIILSADSLDFSAMTNKKTATQTIIIGNAGLMPLTINSLQIEGLALSVSLSNRTIKPEKSARLKVKLTPSLLQEGDPQPQILLITNDPTHPKVVINVKK